MTNIEKRLKLAHESKELIVEFETLLHTLGAESILENLTISKDGSEISMFNTIRKDVEEYSLTDISSVFLTEMEGWGPCSAKFYESFDEAIFQLDYDYKKMKKEKFIKYAGNLYYMKCRCEEIYKRLKTIQLEASSLS